MTDEEALAVVLGVRPLMQESARRGWQSLYQAVYGKSGAPCPRCGAPALIRARSQGDDARTTYWCPACRR